MSETYDSAMEITSVLRVMSRQLDRLIEAIELITDHSSAAHPRVDAVDHYTGIIFTAALAAINAAAEPNSLTVEQLSCSIQLARFARSCARQIVRERELEEEMPPDP